MIDLLIIVITYLVTDGTLGAKLINIMDNLTTWYGIVLFFSLFIPFIGTVILSLVGTAGGQELSKNKIGALIGGLLGFGTGILFTVVVTAIAIMQIFLTVYLKDAIPAEITEYGQLPSDIIFPLVVLVSLIIYKIFFRKEKRKENIVNQTNILKNNRFVDKDGDVIEGRIINGDKIETR